MGFRIRRSKKIGPFRITASNRGVSYSVGGPGARYTVRADGKHQVTLGIPGSGISYTEVVGGSKSAQPAALFGQSGSSSGRIPASPYQAGTPVAAGCASLQQIRQQRQEIESQIKMLVTVLILASPALFFLAFIPGLNALIGILLAIPFFSFSDKLRRLDRQEKLLSASGYGTNPI
jgi:hypothetical protein